MEDARNLSTLLDLSVVSLGLKIYLAKLAFVGLRLSQEESQCSRVLGMPIETLPICYFGFPFMQG